MSRWFLLIGAALVAVFAGVYVWLGGLKTPTVELLTTTQPVYLAGRPFKGVPDAKFGQLTAEAAEFQRRGTVKGVLGNIFYNDVEKKGQPVEAFVGIVVPDTTQPLPVGYQYRSFAAGQRVLRARTDAHFMLAPGKLYSALKEQAEQRKLKLRNVFVEQFPENAPAEVMATVQ